MENTHTDLFTEAAEFFEAVHNVKPMAYMYNTEEKAKNLIQGCHEFLNKQSKEWLIQNGWKI